MTGGYRASGYAGLRRLAIAARIFIVIYMALLVLVLLAGTWTLSVAPRADEGTFIGMLGLLVILVGIALIPAGIAVPLWTHRAHAHMREVGLNHLTYSPGWAAASFFVPLANLVVPFRAMRELWNRSHGEDQYQAAGSVPDVGAWWSCFIAGGAIVIVLTALVFFDAATRYVIITPPLANIGLTCFAVVLLIAAGFYLFRIIGAITRAQGSLAPFGEVFA